jgi:hypothetical protein
MVWDGNKVVIISIEPSSFHIMIYQEHVEYFNHLHSMISNEARCTCGINPEFPYVKNIIQQEEAFFFSLANWT